MEYIGYCVRCKKKVTIENPQEVSLKNGRTGIKGNCPYCKGNVYVFTKSTAN